METNQKHLLLLHGFPLSPAMWNRQKAAFAAAGYNVLTPELRTEQSPATMRLLADRAIAAMDEAGVPSAIVVGFSMGGYVAFEIADRFPERVGGLILTCTKAEADAEEAKKGRKELAANVMERGAIAAADSMLGRLFSPKTPDRAPEIIEEAKQIILSSSPQAIAAAALGMAERSDRTAMLSGINVPTLVIVGEDDAITPPHIARDMAAAIPGAELAFIPEAGHMVNMEQPEAFHNIVLSWLNRM